MLGGIGNFGTFIPGLSSGSGFMGLFRARTSGTRLASPHFSPVSQTVVCLNSSTSYDHGRGGSVWRIWKSRNWVVFEGKQFRFLALMRQFHQQCEEWERVPTDRMDLGQLPTVHSPGLLAGSSLVCMWDGATRAGSHSVGEMVLLDSHREVLRVQGVQFRAIDDPLVVEALVLREALLWCVANGLQDVRFEGDAKVIIDKINQAETRDSRIGMILEEIWQCMENQSGFSLGFVGRRNNRVAHAVARKTLSLYPSTCRSFNFQAWLFSRV
ncbi:unnamed protein product [Linum trigynum]|uniref:RNase H type-1 domain-containing protein n=1 Tax=Linum trigynum TaxID=586398 RepID=A0AAV2GRN6_9ROSI